MRTITICLALLTLASFARGEDDARLTCLADQGATCGDPIPASLAPPLNTLAFMQLNATGLQNYTCREDKFYLLGARTDLYNAVSGEFAGYLYTQAAENPLPIFMLTNPENTTVLGTALTARASDVNVDVKPADSDVNAVWYRREVLNATGIATGVAWSTRTDVEGGAAPNGGACTGTEEVQVPIHAIYTLYACP